MYIPNYALGNRLCRLHTSNPSNSNSYSNGTVHRIMECLFSFSLFELSFPSLFLKIPAGMTPANRSTSSLDTSSVTTERVGDGCTKDDIVIHQGATAPLPNGIPTYTVQVLNVCAERTDAGCELGQIHLSCGWFSSARLVNPRVFRRLRYDDCLVNDGRPFPSGSSLSFQYANSFPYQLTVSSASCV